MLHNTGGVRLISCMIFFYLVFFFTNEKRETASGSGQRLVFILDIHAADSPQEVSLFI